MARESEISGLGVTVAEPFAERMLTKRSLRLPTSLTTNFAALSITAERVIVIEPGSNTVLFAKNPSVRRPIASIQKLLTALLVIERGPSDELIEILPEDLPADARCLPMTAGLQPGHAYSRQSLLTAMLVGSANDAASALARDHSGSVETFVDAMNVRAKKLGMNNSRFCNPGGLPHEGQFSTAEDVAVLARKIDEIPGLRAIVATPACDLTHGDGSTVCLKNTNRLLRTMTECDGMKTGFTRASGHCLVASGSFREIRRIVIALNSTADQIWNDARQLLTSSLGIPDPPSGAALVSD